MALAQTRLAEYPLSRAEELRKPAALNSNDGLTAALRATRETADPLEPDVKWTKEPSQQALRGGPDYGIESRNIHNAIIERTEDVAETKSTADVPAHFVSLDNLRFGPLGATGNQRVAFDRGKSWYITETTQGRLDKLTIVRIGRIAGLWNKARHVIVYERRTRSSDRFATGYEDRAALRKVDEFVEITEVERRYPESGSAQDSMSAGPLRGAAFATPRIPVDGSLGRDIPGGWICPLREATESKGVAQLLMARAEEKGGGLVPHQVEDCGTLSFFTSTDKRDAADPDKWPAVLGVDVTPEIERPDTAFDFELQLSDEEGNYGFQPPPRSAELLQSALSIRVRRPTEATAVSYARGAGMEAFVDRVTIGRGGFPTSRALTNAAKASQEVAELVELLALDYERLSAEAKKKWTDAVNERLGDRASLPKFAKTLFDEAANKAVLNVETGLSAIRREVEDVRKLLDDMPDDEYFKDQARPIWELARNRLEKASAGITRVSLNIEGVVAACEETLAACEARMWGTARAEARSLVTEIERFKKAWALPEEDAIQVATELAVDRIAEFLGSCDELSQPVLDALAAVRKAIEDLPKEQQEKLRQELSRVEPEWRRAVVEFHDRELEELAGALDALKTRLSDLLPADDLKKVEASLGVAVGLLNSFAGPNEEALRDALNGLRSSVATRLEDEAKSLVSEVCGPLWPKDRAAWRTLRDDFDRFPTQDFRSRLAAQASELSRAHLGLSPFKDTPDFKAVLKLARELDDSVRMVEREWTEAQLAVAARLDTAARTAIQTLRIHGTPPITETLTFGRQAVAYYYKEAQRVVDFTESTVEFARSLESEAANHAVQLKVRARALGDELETRIEKEAKKVLGSFAGLTKVIGAELFPGLSFGDFKRPPRWLSIKHGQDPKRLTAWTKLSIDADGSVLGRSPTLLALGPARIALNGPRLVGNSGVTLDRTGARREQTSASLKADWTVEIAGKMLFVLGGAELKMNEQGKLEFDFSPKNLRLSPELSIFSNVMAALNPSQENGFALVPRLNGVRASYDLSLPPIGVVAGGITNAALSTHVDLLYEKGGLAIGMGAWLSRPERPFALSIAFLAGGGYAGFTLRTQGGKPTLDVEIAISAGAAVPINTGFMRGSAGVMLSAGLIFKGGAGQLGASMTLALWGHFDFGIASANVSAVLRIVYDGKKLTGRGYVRVTFKICRWIKIRVGGHFDLPFIGSSSEKNASSALIDNKSFGVLGDAGTATFMLSPRDATQRYFDAISFE